MRSSTADPTATAVRQANPASLIDILVSSLEALAAAEQADAACRLAGRACATLRNKDPDGWRKFNALLHRLSKSMSRQER